MKEFLAMGGYAAYVWTAYGMTAAVIALNVWSAQRRLRRVRAELEDTALDSEPARQPTVRKIT